MSLQDSVHRLALIVGQLQFLHDLRIVPELSPLPFKPKGSLHGRPVIPEPGAHSSARPLRGSPTAGKQNRSQPGSQPYCNRSFHSPHLSLPACEWISSFPPFVSTPCFQPLTDLILSPFY